MTENNAWMSGPKTHYTNGLPAPGVNNCTDRCSGNVSSNPNSRQTSSSLVEK